MKTAMLSAVRRQSREQRYSAYVVPSLKPCRGFGLEPQSHTSQFHSASLESQGKSEELKIFESILSET